MRFNIYLAGQKLNKILIKSIIGLLYFQNCSLLFLTLWSFHVRFKITLNIFIEETCPGYSLIAPSDPLSTLPHIARSPRVCPPDGQHQPRVPSSRIQPVSQRRGNEEQRKDKSRYFPLGSLASCSSTEGLSRGLLRNHSHGSQGSDSRPSCCCLGPGTRKASRCWRLSFPELCPNLCQEALRQLSLANTFCQTGCKTYQDSD